MDQLKLTLLLEPSVGLEPFSLGLEAQAGWVLCRNSES